MILYCYILMFSLIDYLYFFCFIFFFFFLMIRRPPRSTLFPTRRSSDLAAGVVPDHRQVAVLVDGELGQGLPRSEEHTSELQSQSNLVCRLLLEKKKKKKKTKIPKKQKITNNTRNLNQLLINPYTI